MELFAGLARGSYLGCIGWTTLIVSNSVATVGQIFIVQSIAMMVAGPVIGVMVDRHKRRILISMAQGIITAAMIGMAGLLYYAQDYIVLWMFCIVLITTTARLTYRGAFDGIIRSSVEDADVTPTVARAWTIHLLSTAAGMAAVGVIIDQLSAAHGFIASASTSVLVLFVSRFLTDGIVKSSTRGLQGYWSDFKSGLEIFKSNKLIQMLALLFVVALPVGQLSNAVLSSFIRDDLGQGSDVFGFVDAAWAIGGMIAAALLSNKIEKLKNHSGEYVLSILAGLSTIALSFGTEIIGLSIAHGLMGFFVWLCRIIINGKVIALCTNETVGRTRVYMEVLFAVSAMLMCLSPTIIRLEATASYFLYWGIIIVLCSGLLWCWKVMKKR